MAKMPFIFKGFFVFFAWGKIFFRNLTKKIDFWVAAMSRRC